ncbi:hypothetical protein [Klebsiella phage vB_KpnS-VAC51]|uniref:Uncharacterized protein n=1 Tax=Klebsiella phage vB_KpnS-VAC51 TaxID=2866698 RepID=A0AAE8YEE6_9CAUD|nr:hypothetical protein [Klebsiella phage vB_KpnS-VAC51]WOZ53458.1 hypothetical protein pKMKP103_CDS0009 [Klebsiella phage pKMKP103]
MQKSLKAMGQTARDRLPITSLAVASTEGGIFPKVLKFIC